MPLRYWSKWSWKAVDEKLKEVNDFTKERNNMKDNSLISSSLIFFMLWLVVLRRICFLLLTTMQTPERDFRIKISGLEIYNENVRDLLNSESGRSLKLLDDPEVSFRLVSKPAELKFKRFSSSSSSFAF